MNFLQASEEEIQKFGRDLLNNNRDSWDSFEAVCKHVVTQVYENMKNDDGERVFELVRIFRMVKEDSLPPEGQKDTADSEQWLSLVATVGREDAWNERLQSDGHRLLPSGAFETPMLKRTFEQLGLTAVAEDSGEVFAQAAGFMAKYFHVEQAAGSPYIVVQDEFVNKYGIKSVVGIGSPFITGSMYIMLGFASTPISQENAQKYSKLAPFVGALLAYYEEMDKPIWQPA